MTDKDVLEFDYEPVGGDGKVRLEVRLGREVIALDKLDITSAGARDRFARQLCKDRPGIDQADVGRELLSIAGGVQAAQRREPAAGQPARELDVSRIVRPERFITSEVSGLTVATPTLRDGKPAGRWMLYLRWTDGKREAMELPHSIHLPGGRKLWIHPRPGEPGMSQAPAWMEKARRAWLAGCDSPDPADVFKRLCQCIAYYIDFPQDRAPATTATLALWVLLTYCYAAWPAIPYLYLGGPAGSGKTRVFEVLSRLVFRPLQSSSLSAAALFRTLHGKGGTLLYDEAERLRETTPEMGEINSMLLAGYKRGGRATRLEPVDDTWRAVEFDVFGPKALACIKGLPPVLSSRCITVIMFRASRDSERPRRHIDAHLTRWQALRAELHALALDHGADFLSLAGRAEVCPAMSGRDFELWQPLLALASWVEYHGAAGLLGLMQDQAAASAESGQEEQTPDCDEVLLRALAEMVQLGRSPIPKEVLEAAREQDGEMFRRWSAKGAANALRRYGIETRKTHGRRAYGHVTVDGLRRIQTTYNMDLALPEDGEGRDIPSDVPQVPQVPRRVPGAASVGSDGGLWGT